MPQPELLAQINDIGPTHPIVPVRHTTDDHPEQRKRREKKSPGKPTVLPPARKPPTEDHVDEYV